MQKAHNQLFKRRQQRANLRYKIVVSADKQLLGYIRNTYLYMLASLLLSAFVRPLQQCVLVARSESLCCRFHVALCSYASPSFSYLSSFHLIFCQIKQKKRNKNN